MTPLPQPARALIDSNALAHVVTLNADGSPHVTLAWTGMDDDVIVMATLFDQRKLKNLRRDPRIVLSFETAKINEYGLNEYLVVYGRAEIVEGGAPELLQRFAHRHLGPEVTFPAMPDPPGGFVTRVHVGRIQGVGPWTPQG